jgi:hypothetical protein
MNEEFLSGRSYRAPTMLWYNAATLKTTIALLQHQRHLSKAAAQHVSRCFSSQTPNSFGGDRVNNATCHRSCELAARHDPGRLRKLGAGNDHCARLQS